MATDASTHGAQVEATAATEVLPGKKFKWVKWRVSGATVGTSQLTLSENDATGYVLVDHFATITDGEMYLPMPEHEIEGGIEVDVIDNGTVIAAPIK